MKLFESGKEGGNESTVTGYWVIEIKNIFSIVLLVFEKGSREAYHSHAFNAITWFIKGEVIEYFQDGSAPQIWEPSIIPKYTSRACFHKVYALEKTYAISFIGPWCSVWSEYLPKLKKFVTLTHGRKVVREL